MLWGYTISLTHRRRIFFVGAERNERSHKITKVDFVFDRLKAQKQRHSNALVKGFPTPPSSCQTDTALLRSVYLLSIDTAQRVVLLPTPTRVCLRACIVVLHRRRLLCPTNLQPHGFFPSRSVRPLAHMCYLWFGMPENNCLLWAPKCIYP